MSINNLIIKTLKEIIPDVYPDFYQGNKKKYIVFNFETSSGTAYADNEPQGEEVSILINIYVDDNPKKYTKDSRMRLYKAGFTYPNITLETYEKDTRLYHTAMSCTILTNTDLKEE